MVDDDPACVLMRNLASRLPGRRFPDTYLVFDTETSGANDPYNDRILQFGVCVVKAGKVHTQLSLLVQRGTEVTIDPAALRVHHITHDRMAKEGVPPAEAFGLMVETFNTWQSQRGVFVGHNIMAFDAPRFEHECRLLGLTWRFADESIIDTGMLVKALRLYETIRTGEKLRDFYARISQIRRLGVRWSLGGYCAEAYDLKKYGVDTASLHDAGVDCRACHFLLQELCRRHAPKEPACA